jgi:tetratricopeptide (TPR) repeat protein
LPLILNQAKQFQTVGATFILLVLLLFSIRVISRNKDWKDDRTLYTHDVEISVNSARGNDIAGEWYAWMANQPEYATDRQKYFEKAIYHLRRAVEIHPKYQNAMFQLGNLMYDYKKDIDSTFYFYTRVLELDSNEKSVLRNTGLLLPSISDTAKKARICRRLYELNPNNFDIVYHYALSYDFSNLPKAMPLMLKAYELQPQNTDVMKFLGSAYYSIKDYKQSARFFEEAVKLLPKEKTLLQNLYFTWQELGNKEKAAEYLRLSQAL